MTGFQNTQTFIKRRKGQMIAHLSGYVCVSAGPDCLRGIVFSCAAKHSDSSDDPVHISIDTNRTSEHPLHDTRKVAQ